MNFAERLVQAAAKKLGEPEKQRAENGECRGNAHDKMEMAGDEIVADGSGGEIVARQENPGKSAGEKKRNETEREEHGGVELHARGPEDAKTSDEENHGGRAERRRPRAEGQQRKK